MVVADRETPLVGRDGEQALLADALARIYAKLGVRSRVQLTAVLARA